MAVSNVELRVGATQAITALKNVNTQAQKFNQTVNGTNSKLKDANKALPMMQKGFFGAGAGAKGAAGGVRALGAAVKSSLFFITGITTAIGLLSKVFTNLAAQDFAIARVRTLGVNVEALRPQLASLSNELSGQVSQLSLLQASYDLASAGFAETAEITNILKAAQLGATGGFSDLQTVTDATTSVLNAYGLEADKAGKIVDGFAQTQADGKIVVDQYAQQIGRIAPIAAGAGVSIDELNAAISAVTATGVPVESTFAGLRQVIASIQKPTGEASKVAEKLGIDFSAAALKSKGLSGVLEEIVASGGSSADNLSKLFGSVEALTAIQPLLNDELVKFNEALKNQANAQGRAAQDAFTATNTIQGQLTRLGSAFTNLTTEGSEFGIIIREVLKVTAVTVEALGLAVKAVFLPFRQLFALIGEIGKVIGEAIGVDATATLFNLEQGWIGIKEAVSNSAQEAIFFARVVGGVIGKVVVAVAKTASGIKETVSGIVQTVVSNIQQAIQNLINIIPDPIKKLLGGLELPSLNLDIKIPKLENPFKGLKEKIDELKEGVIEFSGVEKQITEENNKQVDAKNKIVSTNGQIKKDLKDISTETKNVTNETDKLKDKFNQIGQDIEKGIVSNLADAVEGTKTLADAAINVLNKLKRKLIEVAIEKAVSGIGGSIGGFLKSAFGLNKTGKARGGLIRAGSATLVGEKGPEIFTPRSSGMVTANDKISVGGGSGITNNIVVNVDASGTSVQGNDADANQFGEQLAAAIQAEIINQKRSGGLLN